MFPERTVDDALFDIRYAREYGELLHRFYLRVAGTFTFLEIIAGTTAFGAWLAQYPSFAAGSGLAITALAILNHVISPSEKAWKAEAMTTRYTELDKKAKTLSLDDLENELKTLQNESKLEVQSLRYVAYKRVVEQENLDVAKPPLTFMQNAISLVV
jgi:hypothetical protein